MKIRDSEEIITPFDNPVDYQPDWRYRIARCLVPENLPLIGDAILDTDDTIKLAVDYMRERNAERKLYGTTFQPKRTKLTPAQQNRKYTLCTVFNWADADPMHNNGLRYLVEAALLTSSSYKQISDDFKIDKACIEIYEKLNFNVRDESGADINSPLVKMRFTNIGNADKSDPDVYKFMLWRLTALRYGYDILLEQWGMGDCDDYQMQKVIGRRCLGLYGERALTGEMSTEDALTGVQRMNERIKLENEKANNDRAALLAAKPEARQRNAQAAWFRILQDLAPKMEATKLTAEEKLLKEKALRSKLGAQQKVDQVKLEDKGPEEARRKLQKQLTDRVQEAVS